MSADSQERDDQPRPDVEQPTRVRYLVLGWLCAAAMIAYIQRNSLGAVESLVSEELQLSEREMGGIMSAFFVSYAFLQIPTGWIGQVLGGRRALPLFGGLSAVATGLAGVSGGLVTLWATRFLAGVGQAGLFPCCTSTFACWFNDKARGLPNGSLAASMSIGGAMSMGLTGLLVESISWRAILGLYASLGVAWSVAFYFWFRDTPREHPQVNHAELSLTGDRGKDDVAREPTPWRAMFTSVALWWICGQQFFRAAGYIFFGTWFPRYLQETRGISVSSSALFATLPLIGVVLGALCGGSLVDWLYRVTGSRRISRQGLAIGSMLSCAVLVFVAYAIQAVTPAVLTISLAAFCAAVGGPAAYTITIDMGGKHVAPVFATMNMTGNVGAILFPLVVPFVQEWYGWPSVLLVFGAMYVGAALCWALLKPDGSVFDQTVVKGGDAG